MAENIHRHMTIDEIFRLFPKNSQSLAEALAAAGLNCVGCMAASWESLEAGMRGHGLSDDEIDKTIDQLNQIVQEEESADIQLTPIAAQKFREIADHDHEKRKNIRLGLREGGCCESSYFLDFSKEPGLDDEVFESQGIQIHVRRDFVLSLLGTVIDFVEGKHGSGFRIIAPSSGCSCHNHCHENKHDS